MKSKRQGLVVDFYHLFGYLSGLLFIKPEMDPSTLVRTAALVHILDAILCRVIAGHSGRQKLLGRSQACSLGSGLGNIVLVAEKTELSLERALRYGESVRTLELLLLSNDKSESMLLCVRDRKRPTPYS